MQEEKRPLDPTRRLLRVFGVKVTTYEEQVARILESADSATSDAERLRLASELVELSADLNQHLREITAHVLDTQAQALARLKTALQQPEA